MIRHGVLVLAVLCAAGIASAQDAPSGLAEAKGAVLRALDKVAGASSNVELASGQSVTFGKIEISLRECRYPKGDPSSNAYAFVTVTDKGADTPVFAGWLIADSPALSALDHPRYDVWAIHCKTD